MIRCLQVYEWHWCKYTKRRRPRLRVHGGGHFKFLNLSPQPNVMHISVYWLYELWITDSQGYKYWGWSNVTDKFAHMTCTAIMVEDILLEPETIMQVAIDWYSARSGTWKECQTQLCRERTGFLSSAQQPRVVNLKTHLKNRNLTKCLSERVLCICPNCLCRWNRCSPQHLILQSLKRSLHSERIWK